MYGGEQPVAYRADIEIANIPNRSGQRLRNLLIDRIYVNGRPADARYELRIAPLTVLSTGLGIQQDATATRNQIEITARVMLVDTRAQTILMDRKMRAVGGYDVLDEQYATLVTRKTTTGHILADLADDITLALDLYFRSHAG